MNDIVTISFWGFLICLALGAVFLVIVTIIEGIDVWRKF